MHCGHVLRLAYGACNKRVSLGHRRVANITCI